MKAPRSFLGALAGVLAFLLLSTAHLWHAEPAKPISGGARIPVADKSSFGNTEDPDARLRYEWLMLRDPSTGKIPRDIRRREMEFARALPTKETGTSFRKGGSAGWVSRGPWNVGGRTRALGIDALNPNLIIAGGVSGGMWRSSDGGATWGKTSTANSLHSVSCLAQDTRTGQTATWYYGTGEFVGNSAAGSGASFSGDGIFKSTNSGASWTLLPATSTGVPQTFDNFFDYVWNIAVDPTNGNVFAATYGAIFRSTNGGTTWSNVLGGVQPYSSLTDIQVAANGTIYATGSGEGGMAGVWRSTTGAAGTWTNISPNDMLTTVRRIVVGIAPSNNSIVYIVAETPSAGTNGHSLWRYNGTTWTNRSANMPAYGGAVGNFDSQGSYDLVMKVKPDNENVVIIGGTNLYRSTDGFATTGNTTWIGGYSTANDISLYPNHHPDNHALAFAPNNASVLYSGHDGGISKSVNILATPHVWQPQSPGYLTTQCYTVALDHGTIGDPSILSGFQDNGCWGVGSSSPAASWNSLLGGDGAFTAIANGGSSVYVSSQNGRTYRLFGSQFARVDPQGGAGYLFINPFVLDPNNSTIMYFAGGEYLWRNSNLTGIPPGSNDPPSTNWTRLENTRIAGGTVTALGVTTTNPPNRVYVGWEAGYLLRVDNAHTAGYTVADVGAAIPTGYISCAAVNPADGNKVLVVFSNYNLASLWYTADAGATWTDVEGNLAGASGPSCRYATIVTHGGVTTYLLGTSTGLYSTTALNGTSTVWTREGASTIGNVVVPFLDSRNSDGVVIVGTHANGTYSSAGSVDVEEQGTAPAVVTLDQNYPNPFNPSTTIRFSTPEQVSRAKLAIYDLAGRIVWSKDFVDLHAGHHAVQWNGETMSGTKVASGTYMYKLSTGNFSSTKRMVLIK